MSQLSQDFQTASEGKDSGPDLTLKQGTEENVPETLEEVQVP
jgi:hypothetical protein